MGDYVFSKKHREYMSRAYSSVINVAEGAVRAGKTVDNVFVFAALLENSRINSILRQAPLSATRNST